MYDLWVNLGMLIGALIAAGFLWLILYIFGKTVIEDMLGGFIKRMRRKIRQKQDDDDQYIY